MNKEEIDIIENLIDKYTTYIGDSLSDFEMVNGRDVALKTDLKSALLDLNTFHNHQTATLQQELDRLKNPWVSVKERLPIIRDAVMVTLTNGLITIGYRTIKNERWVWQLFGTIDSICDPSVEFVTHWCELPEPPQQ